MNTFISALVTAILQEAHDAHPDRIGPPSNVREQALKDHPENRVIRMMACYAWRNVDGMDTVHRFTALYQMGVLLGEYPNDTIGILEDDKTALQNHLKILKAPTSPQEDHMTRMDLLILAEEANDRGDDKEALRLIILANSRV